MGTRRLFRWGGWTLAKAAASAPLPLPWGSCWHVRRRGPGPPSPGRTYEPSGQAMTSAPAVQSSDDVSICSSVVGSPGRAAPAGQVGCPRVPQSPGRCATPNPPPRGLSRAPQQAVDPPKRDRADERRRESKSQGVWGAGRGCSRGPTVLLGARKDSRVAGSCCAMHRQGNVGCPLPQSSRETGRRSAGPCRCSSGMPSMQLRAPREPGL